MSKQKKHNQLFITATEWKESFGGRKEEKNSTAFRRLPFHCCALTLQPANDPVCTPDGTVFDIVNIVPYIQKHHCHPVNGSPLQLKDIFKITFHKNDEGEIICPVSRKVFTDYSRIVVIRTTGNVFSHETVEQMIVKLNHWNDLLTEEPIGKGDIVTIQDPTKLFSKNYSDFFHMKQEEEEERQREGLVDSVSQFINTNGTTSRIFNQMKNMQQEKKKDEGSSAVEKEEQKVLYEVNPNVSKSASLTSSANTIVTKSAPQQEEPILTKEQLEQQAKHKILLKHIKRKEIKGLVTLHTSMGDLNFELYPYYAPKACENFLTHCEKGFYDKSSFHRLIRGFMIQGGDPTGNGGESIWNKPFEDEIHPQLQHDRPGVLSMANKGKPNSNTSQFFVTLNETAHLDRKHTAFGRLVGGKNVLETIEQVKTVDAKPVTPIVIERITVYANPFSDEKLLGQIEQQYRKENPSEEDLKVGQWFSNPAAQLSPSVKPTRTGVGKYISALPTTPAPLGNKEIAQPSSVIAKDKKSLPLPAATVSPLVTVENVGTKRTRAAEQFSSESIPVQPKKTKLQGGKFDFSKW